MPETQGLTQEQLEQFYAALNTKNSWGKNEIRQVLLEIKAGLYKGK